MATAGARVEGEPEPLRRRGFLAVAAAVGAALLGRPAKPAEAATGQNFVIGEQNFATAATNLNVTDPAGVTGTSALVVGSDTGWGVWSTSNSGFGVIGISNDYFGLAGVSHAPGCAALLGSADTVGTAAFQGSATTPGAVAGAFFGPTTVYGDLTVAQFSGSAGAFNGNLTIQGSLVVQGTKSAAVRSSDGDEKLVFCLESPESWLEDFGTASLANGQATVLIRPDFASVIDASEYHVFVTPHGDVGPLFVTARTPAQFLLQEGNRGSSSVTFSYRIVARRRDVPRQRLPQHRPVHIAYTPKSPALPRRQRG